MEALSWATGLTVLFISAMIWVSGITHPPLVTWLRLCVFLVALFLLLLASLGRAWGQPLEKSLPYKEYLKQNAKIVWGPEAPIPLFAGQIHQESAWNPAAKSAYACGLTQFTPETAEWISQQYKVDVGAGSCLDPKWAIRAMLRYDKYLSERLATVKDNCSNRRFMLSAYNGGLGWVNRDRNKAATANVDNRDYDLVAPFNAGRAPGFFKENRDYPPRIIKHQELYKSWGGPLTCKEKKDDTKRSESVGIGTRPCDPWRCAGVDRWLCRLAHVGNCSSS